MEDEDSFVFNDQFTASLYRIKVCYFYNFDEDRDNILLIVL